MTASSVSSNITEQASDWFDIWLATVAMCKYSAGAAYEIKIVQRMIVPQKINQNVIMKQSSSSSFSGINNSDYEMWRWGHK